MEFKKGDELKASFSTTKFDYDDDGNVIGFENNAKFSMELYICDKDKNMIESSMIDSEMSLDDATILDLEEEMKFWIDKFAEENDIEKYSLKDISADYGENNVRATLVIE